MAHKKLNSFFSESEHTVKEGTTGRSPRLIEKRNTLMAYRFYYYQKVKSYHFAKILTELNNEFFISQIEINKILRRISPLLSEIRKTPPDLRQLKKTYPHIVWD